MSKTARDLTEFDKAWIRRARRHGMGIAEIGAHFGRSAQWGSRMCTNLLKMPKRHRPAPRVKMDAEQWAEFTRMWGEGVSCREIGLHFGRGEEWVSKHSQAKGLPPRNKFLTNKQVEEIQRRAAAGEHRKQIARELGISRKAVLTYAPNVARQEHPRIKIDMGRADRMVRQGMTHADVAQYFGVQRPAVSKAIKRYRACFQRAAA